MSGDLALATLPVNYVQALNAFYRRRPSLQLKFAGRGIRLAPTWLAEEPDIPEPYTITLKVDRDQAELVISEGILNFLLLELDPALVLERLDPEKAALVIEHALSEPLAALEQTVGCRLSVITAARGAGKWTGPDRPGLPMVLYVERMGIAWSVLRMAPGDIIRLCGFLDANAGPMRGGVDMPVSCRLRVGAATMSLDEIRSLEPGDILFPDNLAGQPETAVAVFGEHLVAPVEMTPNGCRIGARISRGRGSQWQWSLDPRASSPARIDDGRIDETQVKVVFEAGALDLDLKSVQKLAPGATIPFARSTPDGLDILVNGLRIGRGSLVRIGGNTGIRVARLFGRTV